ncbi:hypothetical protein [Saccharomonospora sp. NB11]|jgi:class 3 adenylate cyclase|uniref:hypothetical protein n=1 Tax=Saccharomonospora sp. NB11 TaxID=1642298 RepID=UPI0018D0AB5C|nr:hypothetical protein [Saccharomonospora sp. NB11]
MPELEYRTLVAVDIERSAGRGNVPLHRIRAVLRAAVTTALDRAGIDWNACLVEDFGDGLRLVAPTGTPKHRLLHPFVHELAVHLVAHNRDAGPRTTVRVRMALHAGEVVVGATGPATGAPLEVLARMLDAAPLKAALTDAPSSVSTALLLSPHVYDDTVRHGYPGIDPNSFRRIAFTTKEHSGQGWLHLAPSVSFLPSPEPHPERPSAPSGSTMINTVSGHGVSYAVQNGEQHIHHRD